VGNAHGSARGLRLQVELLEERNLLSLAPVNPMLFGLNQPWVDGSSYLDPGTSRGAATRDAAARLGAGAQRYTGGTVSTYWDWETADYVSDSEMHTFGTDDQDGRKQLFEANGMAGPDGFYSPLAFDQFGQEAGFQTVWVPNLATGDDGSTPAIVNHAADMFDFLNDNAVPVNFVEMGNEYDLGGYSSRFANSEAYIRDHVNTVATRVRDLYPTAEIAVGGLWSADPIWGPPSDYAHAVSLLPPRQATWDSGLAANRFYGDISNFDAVVYHNYRMNGDVLPVDSGTNNENWESALLAFPEASLTNAAQNARSVFGNDIRLSVTEFGILRPITGHDPASLWLNNVVTTTSTWDMLFTAGFYLTGVQQNAVYDVMMRHDFAQLVQIAGLDGQNYAEIDPTGQVMAHLFNLSKQSTQMGDLPLANNPLLAVTVLGQDQLRALMSFDNQVR
jgi:hypothetical protein